MKHGHMNTKIKNQSAAITLEERQLIRAMLPKLRNWHVQTGAVPVNDESIYTRRIAA
jgi:hypothetical protein